jgi:acyl-CoA thioesterase-1
MTFTPRQIPTRRAGLAAFAAALLAPRLATAGPREPVITLLGDSITAGYGLPAADALPAQLSAALAKLGVHGQVRGAGVSGDTTADGLARVDFSVRPDTDLVLVELGGNDLLQGVEPAVIKANLTAIVRRLKARRIKVAMTGLRAPPAIGQNYAKAFDAVFPAVAHAEGVALYPNLLAGVGGERALLQGDGIHPNAAGVKIIAGPLAAFLARAIKGRP